VNLILQCARVHAAYTVDVAARKDSLMATVARYSEMAFTIPAGVVVGYLAGRWLDGRFGTHSLYIFGLVLGAAAGLFQVVRQLMRDPGDGG
jgi:F0F1-type ATP synthase assembly protein I